MKNARRIIGTAVACAAFPALALAAGSGGAAQGLAGQWLGPYAGAQFGFNNSSAPGLDAYSTEVCHPFHVKAATQTAAKLPPIGA